MWKKGLYIRAKSRHSITFHNTAAGAEAFLRAEHLQGSLAASKSGNQHSDIYQVRYGRGQWDSAGVVRTAVWRTCFILSEQMNMQVNMRMQELTLHSF